MIWGYPYFRKPPCNHQYIGDRCDRSSSWFWFPCHRNLAASPLPDVPCQDFFSGISRKIVFFFSAKQHGSFMKFFAKQRRELATRKHVRLFYIFYHWFVQLLVGRLNRLNFWPSLDDDIHQDDDPNRFFCLPARILAWDHKWLATLRNRYRCEAFCSIAKPLVPVRPHLMSFATKILQGQPAAQIKTRCIKLVHRGSNSWCVTSQGQPHGLDSFH